MTENFTSCYSVAIIVAKYDISASTNINSMKLHIYYLYVLLILLLAAFVISNHNDPQGGFKKHNDTSYASSSFSLCNNTSAFSCTCCQNSQEVQITFSTRIVENEYIVTFKGYYKLHTRENYIKAALNSSGVKSWKILPRGNLASGYPSDFDVVLLEETAKYNGLNALNNHPLIRRVTPQRLVHRSLKFINTSDPDNPGYRNLKRKISNYVRSAL